MSEKTEGKDAKKKDAKKRADWKADENITMVLRKSDDWKPDKKLTMKFQEGLKKKKKKTE